MADFNEIIDGAFDDLNRMRQIWHEITIVGGLFVQDDQTRDLESRGDSIDRCLS